MTTEVGSETEVRKEPEKAEEQPAAPEPAATNQTDEAKAAEQSANDHPAPATESAEAPAEAKEKQEEAQPADNATPQEGEDTPASPPASEKKGISRFLPPWLKKQKSQSQVGPKESQAAPKEEAGVASVKEEDGEKEEQAEAEQTSSPTAAQPQVEEEKINGEPKPEQKEEVKSEEKEEENHSTGSADTQPAKEEKAAEESQEKSAAEEENKEAEEGGEEKKDEEESPKPEGGHSFIKSPLKLTKKVKMVMCHVTMLDGSQFPCEVEKRAKGQYLFFKVYEALNLLEKDYFGLSYKDNADQTCWLDPTKEIKRQIRNATWQFAFNVKFYPPDPSQLTEDITRYLLCLQLRQDIVSGRLPCSFVTHSLLGSYALQAELGDHDSGEHRLDYISDFQFAPSQTKEMEEKVVELHKTHRGMTPAQADAQFLENAKKLSMYGVDLHHAKDSEGVDIMLGVCANGLLIYKDRLRINRFAWPKILKISYKRSNFYIKIRPGETEQFESSVGFKLPNHRAAKRVWKVCVENHTFFRLMTPEAPIKAKFLTLGSKFRYSGRTQAQTRQASTLIDRPAPYFERTSSKRISRSLDGAPMINVTEAQESAPTSGENGREPGLELSSDSKVEEEPSEGAAATPTEGTEMKGDEPDSSQQSGRLRVQGENIYVRHSNLMLEDLDKTQEDVLKHQASISELKRSFMEATPEPRPSQWEKRLTASPATSLRLQAQGSLEEEMTSILFSKFACESGLVDPCCTTTRRATEGAVVTASGPLASALLTTEVLLSTDESKPTKHQRCSPSRTQEPPPDLTVDTVAKSADDKQKSGEAAWQAAEVEIEETVVVEEIRVAPKGSVTITTPAVITPVAVESEVEKPKDEVMEEQKRPVSVSSDSEEEEEEEEAGEYHPQVTVSASVDQIKEEPEEEGEEEEEQQVNEESVAEPLPEPVVEVKAQPVPAVVEENSATEPQLAPVAEESPEDILVTPDEAPNGHAESPEDHQGPVALEEEEEEPRVNGDASHSETERLPQVICCSEPPVVKTEMVTISDTFAAQKTEIATKEVPIVHTETKTITYEAAQLDGSGDGEPGVLMTAQTITSESLCTTTTTHITKTLKGGLSETRIEKRIVITGDSDIDHDQALAQAIKEAKEQHPDMSVTRVVVHKETELAEEGED
uniref:band 4.1-like protein 2 isoform X1 n=1 Tax=Oncorhynchus gorbuscha TaxID=8017 RepID=UPI001EAF3D15|nr:band 4.1-like protein 2 isoform X1 [Oncorhynchus gorbuscha]XP_046154248.1 band 4.1-like protein 2 isoform X1 [Oncorhynchus gorbuscha]XP_046154249.1 band 4.1-like protein 2 isoform X1 [Oncorhynchus gorbuscha]XP_046154250.1 band 4.1-like protein 2 isoform X1 [Oncorhynchus gorbuscha]